jgi:hypothetical protein
MTQYDDIIVTPNYGPLSHQYPGAMPPTNLGTLPGPITNPPLFYPSQEPVYSDMFPNARQVYVRTAQSNPAQMIARQKALSATVPYYSYSSQINRSVSGHMNYIAPQCSSQRIDRLKANAIGKNAYMVGLPAHSLYSTKNYFPTEVRTTIRRVRSGGCVAPKKNGAIENNTLRNGQVCAWGALPRQNY